MTGPSSSPDAVQMVADTIIEEMFAPHEIPLDDRLAKLYRKVAQKVLDRLGAGVAQAQSMPWERAETASIDFDAFYLVKDNGGEWRDFDLHIIKGRMVQHKLGRQYIRGRPEWIAKINAPLMPSTTRAAPIDHSGEECPNFPGCHCVDQCCDGWKHPSPENGPQVTSKLRGLE